MGEDRQAADRPPTTQRVCVSEAAAALGISVEAVRGRIKRGTIGHERDDDRVYVLLDADQTATGRDQGDDRTTDRPELVAALQERIEDLRTDRDAWREQARRSDYLLGSSMERTRELEGRLRELEPGSSSATPNDPESPTADAGGADVPDRGVPDRGVPVRGEAAQEGTQRRSWWRRLIGE